MTVTEIQQYRPATELDANPFSLRQPITLGGGRYAIEYVSIGHPDVESALDIETRTFAGLGDKPEEVKEEFGLYDQDSVFMLFKEKGQTDEAGRDVVLGMGRFILYREAIGNKTLNDMSKLVTNGIIDLSSLGIQRATGPEAADDIVRIFEEEFVRRYGCDSMGHVMDIASLAPDPELDFRNKLKVIDGLLVAMNVFGFDQYNQGNITHVTQFTEKDMHPFLQDRMGYPMEEIFGAGPVVYDTFGNGEGPELNMVAVPSLINMHKLVPIIRSGIPKHMQTLQAALDENVGPIHQKIAA